MNELEALYALGIINILKTSVLKVEFNNFKEVREREIKAKSYETIYGINLSGHTEEWILGGLRKSIFETIYKTLWGKKWMKPSGPNDYHPRNSMRDAVHLDVCWMNKADFFVTNEKAIISKRDQLYKLGFDTQIMNPDECLAQVMDNLKKESGTDDPSLILQKLNKAYPIIIGSNNCRNVFIKDLVTGETLFRSHWIDNQLYIEGTIYDSAGIKIVQFTPKLDPEIFHNDAWVIMSDPNPKLFSVGNRRNAEHPKGQYFRMGDKSASYFFVRVTEDEALFSGRILPSGHISFQGNIFNSKGDRVAKIEKREFSYYGMTMLNCTSEVLPVTL